MKITVEIRDLGCLIEKKEVEEALWRDLKDTGEIKVNLSVTNARKQRGTIVEFEDEVAVKLLKQARVMIG